MLRGAAADRDEQFARSFFCASRGIPLHVRRVCIADLAARRGLRHRGAVAAPRVMPFLTS